MYISRILLKKIAPGNIWTGKHRVVKPVKFKHREELYRRLAAEEETMFYLSRPYLTAEQEKNPIIKQKDHQAEYDNTHGLRKYRMIPHTHAEELLLHLRCSENWE